MSTTDIFGFAATGLTIVAFVPQAWRVWKTRSADDLSFGTFSLLLSGAITWLVYGLLRADMPVIVTNCCTIMLLSSIMAMKIVFDRNRSGSASRDPASVVERSTAGSPTL